MTVTQHTDASRADPALAVDKAKPTSRSIPQDVAPQALTPSAASPAEDAGPTPSEKYGRCADPNCGHSRVWHTGAKNLGACDRPGGKHAGNCGCQRFLKRPPVRATPSSSPATPTSAVSEQEHQEKTENFQPQGLELSREASLCDAIVLAARWHGAQRDRQGRPVILHLLRVVLATPDGDAQIVAALHDIVEDTRLTLVDLAACVPSFPPHILDAVDAITRRDSETYREYIARLATNDLARTVKLADLRDNLSRGAAFPSLCERYRKALAQLGATDSLAGAPVPASDRFAVVPSRCCYSITYGAHMTPTPHGSPIPPDDAPCSWCTEEFRRITTAPDFEGRSGDMGEGHYADCPLAASPPVGDATGEPTCECGHDRESHDDRRKKCLYYEGDDDNTPICGCEKFRPTVEAEAQEEATTPEPLIHILATYGDGESGMTLEDDEVLAIREYVASLRARVAQLEATLAEMTVCQCGEKLSTPRCHHCDNDE